AGIALAGAGADVAAALVDAVLVGQVLALGFAATAILGVEFAAVTTALGQAAADRFAARRDARIRGAGGDVRHAGPTLGAAGLGGPELALGLAVLVVVLAAGDERSTRAVAAGIGHA